MIAGLAIDRAQDRQLVGDGCLKGKMFGKANPGNGGGNALKRPTNLGRGVRLGVPHVQMAWPTGKPKEQDGFLFLEELIGEAPAMLVKGSAAKGSAAKEE